MKEYNKKEIDYRKVLKSIDDYDEREDDTDPILSHIGT